jgi:hypothetical protein
VAALVLWAASLAGGSIVLFLARRRGPAAELAARRRLRVPLVLEHVALAVAVLAGAALMAWRGWGLGYARWLAVKVGLTLFLFVPLEAMHAWVCHGWIARGLRETSEPPFSKDLARGIGMDDMVRALAVPLFGLAVPLMIWLSVRRPF